MILRTLRTKVFGTPDVVRWADLGNYSAEWDKRTAAIAALVPAGSNVIEFGAGRRQLPNWLSRECSYTPSDLVARGPDTWVCDLNNRPLPPLPPLSAPVFAVFSGVLEYVVDLPEVLSWLARQVDGVVASHNCKMPTPTEASRLTSAVSRLGAGWVNDLTNSEFIALFAAANFSLEKEDLVAGETAEHIYLFRRTSR